MKSIILALTIFLFFGCDNEKIVEKQPSYFSLDSLINSQIGILTKYHSKLNKKTIFRHDTSTMTFEPDSVLWNNEFNLIKNLDLNKPSFKGAYRVSEEPDDGSNLTVLSYNAINEKYKIRYIKIYYLQNIKNIKMIEIRVEKSNLIYDANQEIKLLLDTHDNEMILNNYRITGNQKMIFQDTFNFSIVGKIRY